MEKYIDYSVQIGLTIAIILAFFLLKWIIRRSIQSFVLLQNHDIKRLSYVLKIINLSLTLMVLMVTAMVWEISIAGLSVYFASIFTIIGIAFFASWSVLSNITAALILFFYYPFKIGSKIKIMDGENSIIGVITNITLFTMIIEADDQRKVVIPNNVVMQKTSVLLD